MIVFTDNEGRIKSVGTNTTEDSTLKEVVIVDDIFDEWSDEKICCYRIGVSEGHIIMLTPYIDSRFIDHFDMSGRKNNENSEALFDLAEIVSNLSERIAALEGDKNG